jgi:hypothetical protein
MLVAIVAITSVFGSTAYIAYVVLEVFRSRYRTRLTSEFQQKLLDRVGSTDQLGAFLSSDGGARILEALSPTQTAVGPHVRILRALQAGLVLLTLGVALFLYMGIRTLPIEGEDVIAMIATVCCALGIGLLLSAGAAYALSRKLGLLSRPGDTQVERAPSV